MENEIVSYSRVGAIKFGMNEAEIFELCENNLNKVEGRYTDEFKLFWKGKALVLYAMGQESALQ